MKTTTERNNKYFRIIIKNAFEGAPFIIEDLEVREYDNERIIAKAYLEGFVQGVNVGMMDPIHKNYMMFHSIRHILAEGKFETDVEVVRSDSILDLLLRKLRIGA